MLTASQRKLRRTMVTATDAVVLAGFSPAKSRTPSAIFLEKTEGDGIADSAFAAFEHEDEDGRVDPVAIQVGNHSEPLAVRLVAHERGLLVVGAETIRHGSIPWIGATPDGFVVAPLAGPVLVRQRKRALQKAPRLGVIEAKAVGFHRIRHWRDEDGEWTVPTYVWAQVQWQMLAASVRIGYVSVLMGTEHRSFVVEHNEALADAMQTAAHDFWHRYVLPRTPPPVDGSKAAWELLRRSFPRVARQALVDVGDEEISDALRLAPAKEEMRTLKEEAELLEQRLGTVIGDARGLVGRLEDGRSVQVTWGERKGYTVQSYDVKPTRIMLAKILDAPGLAKAGPRKRTKEEAA